MLGLVTKNSKIRTSYDRWSRSYDAQENPTRDLDRIVLQSLVPPLAGRQVVEFGCGTGKNLRWLAPRCQRLFGLDFSAGMLAVAKRKTQSPNLQLLQCELNEPVPLAGRFADVVLVSLLLEHMTSTEPVFRNAARLLVPGGWLIVSEYHPERIKAGSGAQFQGDTGGSIHYIGSFAHSAAQMQKTAANCGLHPIDTAEWYLEDQPDSIDELAQLPRILSMRFRRERS